MTTERLKKLKSLKSLQTQCTLNESRQKSLKINILKPLNPMSSVRLGYSGQQSALQQPASSKKVNSNHNLMDVPELSKKQLQGQILQSTNNSQPQQSQRIRVSNKSNQKINEYFDESIDFRQMIITNGSINMSTSKKMGTLGQNNNKIDVLTTKKQQDNISLDEKLSEIIKISQNKENDDEENSIVQIKIHLDQSQQIIQEVDEPKNGRINLVKKQIDFKQVAPKLKLSSKYETIQPFRSEQLFKQNRSKSRIKLRDYLYMVEASGKRVSSRRRQLKDMQEDGKYQPTPSLLNVKSQQKPNLKSARSIQAKDNFTNRKEQIKSKYSVSNRTMFDILKQEICSQIKTAESNLQKVKEELGEVQASNQPTNEQLLILYNLRREMKEYINKKIENTIESIRKEKMSNLLQTSRRFTTEQPHKSKQTVPLKNKN